MVQKHNLAADYNMSLGYAIDNPRKAARKRKRDDPYDPMTDEIAIKHFAHRRNRITFRKMDSITARDILFLVKSNGFLEEVSPSVFHQMPGLDDGGRKLLRVTEKGRIFIDRPFGFLTIFMEKYGLAITFLTGGVAGGIITAILFTAHQIGLALYERLF